MSLKKNMFSMSKGKIIDVYGREFNTDFSKFPKREKDGSRKSTKPRQDFCKLK